MSEPVWISFKVVQEIVLFCVVLQKCKCEMFYLYTSFGSVSLCSHNTNFYRSVFQETLRDLEPTSRHIRCWITSLAGGKWTIINLIGSLYFLSFVSAWLTNAITTLKIKCMNVRVPVDWEYQSLNFIFTMMLATWWSSFWLSGRYSNFFYNRVSDWVLDFGSRKSMCELLFCRNDSDRFVAGEKFHLVVNTSASDDRNPSNRNPHPSTRDPGPEQCC